MDKISPSSAGCCPFSISEMRDHVANYLTAGCNGGRHVCLFIILHIFLLFLFSLIPPLSKVSNARSARPHLTLPLTARHGTVPVFPGGSL